MDGHRRFGTACKYVLWRRRSCGFWRRSSLWSPIFSFLSPVVCSVIEPPRECLKQIRRVCRLSSGSGIVPHYLSVAPKRWAGKKWRNSSSCFFSLPHSPHGSPLEKSLKLKLRVVVCLRPSRGSFGLSVVPKTPTRLWINILTCLAAWTLPAPAVSTCVLSQRFPTTS